jgi:hypothetical protein
LHWHGIKPADPTCSLMSAKIQQPLHHSAWPLLYPLIIHDQQLKHMTDGNCTLLACPPKDTYRSWFAKWPQNSR